MIAYKGEFASLDKDRELDLQSVVEARKLIVAEVEFSETRLTVQE